MRDRSNDPLERPLFAALIVAAFIALAWLV